MKITLVLVISFLFITQIHAGYGCRGTLDGLTNASDLVIIGNIGEDLHKDKDGVDLSDNILINIYVERVLKGNEKRLQIQAYVDFDYDIDGLSRDNKVLFLRTHKLDTSRYIIDNCWIIDHVNSDNDIILEKIQEFVQLDEISCNKKRNRKLVEWYLSCIEYDKTRYTGIMGFSKRGPFYKYNSESNMYVRNKKYKLSNNHKSQLRRYFLNKINFEYNDVFIVDLIRKRKDSEILNKLVEQLNLYNSVSRVWYREFNIMSEILNFTDDSELKYIYEEIEKIWHHGSNQEIQKLTIKFIRRINAL